MVLLHIQVRGSSDLHYVSAEVQHDREEENKEQEAR